MENTEVWAVMRSEYQRHLREVAGAGPEDDLGAMVALLPFEAFLEGMRLACKMSVSCSFDLEQGARSVTKTDMYAAAMRERLDVLASMLCFTRAGAKHWSEIMKGRKLSDLGEWEALAVSRELQKVLLKG